LTWLIRRKRIVVTDVAADKSGCAMRPFVPLLLLIACTVAQRPPVSASRRLPRLTAGAEWGRDPDLCRRMADWECIDLDCPDCSSVAKQARTCDVGQVAGALTALGLASVLRQQSDAPRASMTPFVDALNSGAAAGAANGRMPSTGEASEVDSCRAACRRCVDAKLRCR
jgi:hypothetical protein